jgi:hypothetical protein
VGEDERDGARGYSGADAAVSGGEALLEVGAEVSAGLRVQHPGQILTNLGLDECRQLGCRRSASNSNQLP